MKLVLQSKIVKFRTRHATSSRDIVCWYDYYLWWNYWVAVKIRLKFRPPKFRIYLDRI